MRTGRSPIGWNARPLLLGVVHLAPLPGAPRARADGLARTTESAVADALAYSDADFDGVIVENYGDAPFFATRVPAETVAAMAVVARAVRDALPRERLVGANVLRNDARAALAVAAAAGLDLVRVNVLAGVVATDQGLVQGDAARVLRLRARLCPRVRILADVRVKHAAPLAPRPLAEEARDLAERAGADALVVTGPRTGRPPAADDLQRVREAVPDAPLLVGSGATAAAVRDLLRAADGAIVGTSVKRGGRTTAPVDRARARAFVRAARR
jgi:membrane complex biogenesis BtpA family protein